MRKFRYTLYTHTLFPMTVIFHNIFGFVISTNNSIRKLPLEFIGNCDIRVDYGKILNFFTNLRPYGRETDGITLWRRKIETKSILHFNIQIIAVTIFPRNIFKSLVIIAIIRYLLRKLNKQIWTF